MKTELYDGLYFELPDQPPLDKIQGHDLPKKDQKWRRTEVPENLTELPLSEQDSFIMEEFRRRREGHWFMNNGTPTYITGHHYFYINWCDFSFGYPDYRDVDRRTFYFWQLCEDDPNCYGEIQVKFRRRGATSQGEAIALNKATLNKNTHCGIMSKTGKDASAYFREIVNLIQNLPQFFIPLMDGTDDPKKEVNFKKPAKKLTTKNSKIDKKPELRSLIDWRNTVENAYDGDKLHFAMMDEGGKWMEADFSSMWDIHKECFSKGSILIGKAYLPSTVEEMELKGGKEFKKLWDESNPNKKNENGRTLSGLYRYFVPANDGLEGHIDEYGMSMLESANKYLDSEEAARKDNLTDLNKQRRKYPRKVEDAFRYDNKLSPFDIDRIHDQMDYNALMNEVTVRGNFAWKDGVRDTEVEWQPSENGRWLIAWKPREEKNNFKMKFGKRAPANTETGCFGLDPFDHKATSENKRSNAASYGYLKYDVMKPYDSAIFVSEYINRPAAPEIMYEDMIMQCVFYGWEILIENNKIGCINYFRNRGYDNYLMDRPEETHTEYSKSHQKEKGIPMSGEEPKRQLVEVTQSYIHNNVGTIEEEGKEPRMGKCYFNHLLSDWEVFDPNKDWTPRDSLVGAGLALLGSRKIILKKPERKTIELFKKYDNRGMISREVQ